MGFNCKSKAAEIFGSTASALDAPLGLNASVSYHTLAPAVQSNCLDVLNLPLIMARVLRQGI
jgi:hypothetical protein